MPKKRKVWSRMIEEVGVRIRVFARPGSSRLWYSIVRPDGSKIRRSLQTSNRNLAVERARVRHRDVHVALDALAGRAEDLAPPDLEVHLHTAPLDDAVHRALVSDAREDRPRHREAEDFAEVGGGIPHVTAAERRCDAPAFVSRVAHGFLPSAARRP